MAPIPYQIRDPDGGDSDVNPNELLGFAVLTQGFCVVVPGILWLLRLYVRACVKKVWVLEDSECFFFSFSFPRKLPSVSSGADQSW